MIGHGEQVGGIRTAFGVRSNWGLPGVARGASHPGYGRSPKGCGRHKEFGMRRLGFACARRMSHMDRPHQTARRVLPQSTTCIGSRSACMNEDIRCGGTASTRGGRLCDGDHEHPRLGAKQMDAYRGCREALHTPAMDDHPRGGRLKEFGMRSIAGWTKPVPPGIYGNLACRCLWRVQRGGGGGGRE